MKTKHIPVLCLARFRIDSFGHEEVVHEAITINAAQSMLETTTLTMPLLANKITPFPIDSAKLGGGIEGTRSCNLGFLSGGRFGRLCRGYEHRKEIAESGPREGFPCSRAQPPQHRCL